MKLGINVNIPLEIRMCLECPFYRTAPERCTAECFLRENIGDWSFLEHEDVKVIPDSCPLIKYDKK
jgi:hypothetical protein